jgi:Tol biopolymer transport system component
MNIRVVIFILFSCVFLSLLIENSRAQGSPTKGPVSNELASDIESDFRFFNTEGLKGRIVFAANIQLKERIFMLDLDQKRIQKIVDGPSNNSYPSFSPNGKFISFTSDRDGNKEIYLINSNGQDLTRITQNSVVDDHPSWANDSSGIYFYSENTSNKSSNIFFYNIANKTVKQITNLEGKNSTPQISPDGKTLAYSTNRYWPGWDICLFNISSSSERCPLSGSTSYCRATWANNSNRLAYSAGLLSDIDGWLVDINSNNKENILSSNGSEYDLTWSPDDTHILFASDQETSGIYNLYTYKINDNPDHATQIILQSSHSLRYPSWIASSPQAANAKP